MITTSKNITLKSPYINITGGIWNCYKLDCDYESYMNCYLHMDEVYSNKLLFNKMSLVNISEAGRFAADRSIKEYAERIWKING